MSQEVVLQSNPARDLLQSAEGFKHPHHVIWEYVSNSIQYHEDGIKPRVDVKISRDEIAIQDNGRGMDISGLNNFFTMHGENEDRKRGKKGRGRYGTGKSAAFGIANILRIDSVKNGIRNVVEVSRDDLRKNESSGKTKIPLNHVVKDEEVKKPNGTLITIGGLKKGKIKDSLEKKVIDYIQQKPLIMTGLVVVNEQKCEYKEPDFKDIRTFPVPEDLASILGNVQLIIKIAYTPLETHEMGIKVISSGEVHSQTYGTSRGKEYVDLIFGELEVPLLDDESQDPAPFNASRDGELNQYSPLVQAIEAFISMKVEEVRQEILKEKKVEEKSVEAQKFKDLSKQVASLINSHFREFQAELDRVKAQSTGGFDSFESAAGRGADLSVLQSEGEIPAIEGEVLSNAGHSEEGEQQNKVANPPELSPELEATQDQPTTTASGSGEAQKQRARGGFSVDHEAGSPAGRRSRYDREKRTIFVNTNHPQLAAALEGRDVGHIIFRRLFVEVALTEYVVASLSERIDAGEFISEDPKDTLFELTEKLSSITGKASFLYKEENLGNVI